MAGTTYHSASVPTAAIMAQLAEAQDQLNRHAADVNGICVTCRVTSPCAHREPAIDVFFRYFRVSLPQRRPATGAVEATPVSWFRTAGPITDGPCGDRGEARHAAQ